MKSDDLKARTKTLALRILNLVDALPNTVKGRTVAHQLARAGTSVGANYRAACRARSKAEFIAKIGTVIEEADECVYWMEMAHEGGILQKQLVEPLLDEANQIVAIMTRSRKTAEASHNRHSAIGNRQSP